MRVYVDSSALLKRVFVEKESTALIAHLKLMHMEQAALVSSTLAWIEVTRAVRSAAAEGTDVDPNNLVDVALSGILEKPISSEVAALARRLDPPLLRSLEAIHLASAVLLDVDAIIVYDERLAAAARHSRIRTLSPV